MGGIQCQFNVFGSRARHFGEGFACNRANVIEILAFHWWRPFATDVIFILAFELNRTTRTVGNRIFHAVTPQNVLTRMGDDWFYCHEPHLSTLNTLGLFAVRN